MATVKARIRKNALGAVVEVQRSKYKHWFALGTHRESDAVFTKALALGAVQWQPRMIEDDKLF